MPPRTTSRHVIATCTFHLHTWHPFHLPNSSSKRPIQTLDTSNLSRRMRRTVRKRRRRGSRSVSGRGSDRKLRCGSVGGSNGSNGSNAYGACSDVVTGNGVGSESSGELFEVNWACSDASEADKENVGLDCGYSCCGNESGDGSEAGYRADVDEEDDHDGRVLFSGNRLRDTQNMEIENSLQKAHHRCRRKKHEFRMIHAV